MKRIKEEQKEISEKLNKKPKHKFKRIIFLLIIISIVILAIFTACKAYKWQNMAIDIISNTPSTVLDSDNNVIAELGKERKQSNISYSEMPKNLVNAYVSIEDQRFYNHFGIDIKRTSAAIFSYIFKGNSSFGGSSITQQLVKNITNDNSSSVTRKISEWIRAVELEAVLSKEEILEAYLNIIYVGPNIYGVNNGAKYYFDKDISELTLTQCAFLAGLNHSPNSYNPFGENDNSEKIFKRTKTVLTKMLELGYISDTEHTKALKELDESGLSFKKGTISTSESSGIYNYHTDALISEIIKDISEEKDISLNFATNYINMAGLKIYSTQNTNIQTEIEKEFNKNKYIIKSKNDTNAISQAAMVVIDHKNGYVLGCVGGLGEKTISRGFNRATQAVRQTGSASKPLAVLLPALDTKTITSITMLNDTLTTFDDGTEEGYTPINYNNYLGNITVRRAVESSQNIPFVRIMEVITPSTSISYLKKMGVTSLTDVDNNINLALGGLDKGISPLEMAGAYATISNNGVYIEPTFYTKIENKNNKTILRKKQESRKVVSEQVSYILKNLLTEPVKRKKWNCNIL